MYATDVKVTAAEFRRNVFKLVEKVIAGETVEFIHQGTPIRLMVPLQVDRLTPLQISNPSLSKGRQRTAEQKLQAEMWAEIEKDWAEI
jgi:antitoxin (DNA-binding transcriptional repressor) of toxin-antitoxin stability system